MIRKFCHNCFRNLIIIKKYETDNFIRTVSICDYCGRNGSVKYTIGYSSKNEIGLINEEIEAFEKNITRDEDLSELVKQYLNA